MNKFRTTMTAAGLVAALSFSTACNGGSNPKVATLGSGSNSSSSNSSASSEDFRDAMLDYAKCMRQHGVDMPDPTFDDSGKGGISVIGTPNGGGLDPNSATYKAADAACKPILDAAEKNAPRPSPEEEAKRRDQALKFAQCMRAKGFDVPDPTFDDNGGMKIQANGANAGPSTASGGTTEPDPKFQQAAEDCGKQSGMSMVANGTQGGHK